MTSSLTTTHVAPATGNTISMQRIREEIEQALRELDTVTAADDDQSDGIGNAETALRRALETIASVAAEPTPMRFFAFDGDNGSFSKFDTLNDARADALQALDFAGIDGWPAEGPSICYGAVFGEAREVTGSRRPAPAGYDFDELVDYELVGPAPDMAAHPASAPSPTSNLGTNAQDVLP